MSLTQKAVRPGNWRAGLLNMLLLLCSSPAGAELTLETAERLALEADPAVIAARSRAAALQEQSVADGQLPDPKLGIGLYNVPLDDFSLEKEPSTQFRTRVQQAFPRGRTLKYRQSRTEWLGEAESARTKLVRREIQRDVRETWFELYYQQQADGIISESRKLFEQLLEITRSHFATGRVTQQDVLQARLELSRLDDRASRIREQADIQQARLDRWIGEEAWQPLDRDFPQLARVPGRDQLLSNLAEHPAIVSESARIESHNQAVKAAREQYKPGWNLGLEYRKRFGEDNDGDDRTDMMAAMVTVDLPLFPAKRQDKRLAASQQRAESARQVREQRMRELRRTLNSDYSRWERLGEQEVLYREHLLHESRETAEAALHAYQNGLSEFSTLMRARITQIDMRIQHLRVKTHRARARARLLFLAPEGVNL